MEFVLRFGRPPVKIETMAEPGQGAASGLVEGLSFPHDRLKASRQERTDGASLFGSHHSRLSQQVRVELQGDVGFHLCSQHDVLVQHHFACCLVFVAMVGGPVRGDPIGLSGNSDAPHLHFDVASCVGAPDDYNALPCGQTVPVTFRNTLASACGLRIGVAYPALAY
jgi:hypothetical protein